MPWESSRDFIRDCLATAMERRAGENGPGTLHEHRGENDRETWFSILGTWRLYARFLAAVAARNVQTADILDFSMVPRYVSTHGSDVLDFTFFGYQLEDFGKGNDDSTG